MGTKNTQFECRLAQTPGELEAAQRLRYRVFVDELGGDGTLVDHEQKLERDRFDPFFDHLLLLDHNRDNHPDGPVVGVYRLMQGEAAKRAGSFYSESEYDLAALKSSGRKLLELGRSCLHEEYRGGMAMYHLWNGLSAYVHEHEIEVLFGVASFHGVDIDPLKEALSLLHHNHLAPEDLRVRAQPTAFQSMNLMAADEISRKQAMLSIPALIKAYLRLGGFVGEGAYIDHEFNTTDVCLLMDTKRMNARKTGLYDRRAP
ncbi:GNAT family N-acetyltransferase [Halocynthiibacter namhaensis]|uniref:GNAT family N-acetyltransferase n=1 Tax=Halocynthiibacter namhaensis TaxID=1290553 RepID=UPI000578F62D|nr:GNAT family N-acyltransferase [Halocynthiibacter namhaensis]